ALVQGEGIRLRFSNGRELQLREVGSLIQFDGAWGAQCELIGGRCMDLNLMAAHELRVEACVHRLNGPWRHTLSPGAWGLVMPLSGPITLRAGGRGAAALQALDLALLEPADTLEMSCEDPHSDTPTPTFF